MFPHQDCWSDVPAEIILDECHGTGSADWDTCHVAERTGYELAIATAKQVLTSSKSKNNALILPADGLNSLTRMKMVGCLCVVDGVGHLADDPVVFLRTGKLAQRYFTETVGVLEKL